MSDFKQALITLAVMGAAVGAILALIAIEVLT